MSWSLRRFRAFLKKLVHFASDQKPCWVKVKPCAQVFVEFEVPTNKERKQRNKQQSREGIQTMVICEGDESDEDNEHAMAGENGVDVQQRGENACDQDKYRVTIDPEQRGFGYFEDDCPEPQFEFGTWSVFQASIWIGKTSVVMSDG